MASLCLSTIQQLLTENSQLSGIVASGVCVTDCTLVHARIRRLHAADSEHVGADGDARLVIGTEVGNVEQGAVTQPRERHRGDTVSIATERCRLTLVKMLILHGNGEIGACW